MSEESRGSRGAGDVLPDGSGDAGGEDRSAHDGGDGRGSAGDVQPATADRDGSENEDEAEAEEVAPRLSDDGIMLAFTGAASLLAATTASVTGEPRPIAVFAGVAGGTAIGAFAVDVVTDYVPDNRVHLLVGAAALVGALFALPGRDWVNVATLGVAAALVLWRVVDTEYRGAER